MLILTIYVLTFAVGLPANVFTFAILLKKARRHLSPSDILLLNLTSADLLLLLFLPFKMAEAAAGMTWPLPMVLCPMANFCFYSSIHLSSLFLMALSVERYLGVVFPLQFKDRRRPRRALATSVVLWLLACSHCSIIFVAEYHGGGNQTLANRSLAVGSDGSVVNGFKPSSSKMAEPDGFHPSSSKISSPTITNPKGVEISSPTIINPKVLEIFSLSDSTGDDFGIQIATSNISTGIGSRISTPSGPKTSNPNISGSRISTPSGPKTSNPNISGSRISTPSGPQTSNPNISGSRISTPSGPKTSNPKISGSRISTPSGPKTSKPNISSSRISTLSSPKTSNPNISGSRISTPNSAKIPDPTDVSQTSTTPSWSSPGVHNRSTNIYKCYDNFSDNQLSFVLPLRLEMFLVLFLLPFTVTVFCYVNFVWALLARPNIPPEKKHRAVGLALATIINFGVCFAPYNVSHVVGFAERRSPGWRSYALLLTSLNAALDPIIFYFSSTAVQRAVGGVGAAVGGKIRGAVGWCYGVSSSEGSRNEAEGSLS